MLDEAAFPRVDQVTLGALLLPLPLPPSPFIIGTMTRRFVVVTVCLTATIAFLIGLIVAGSMTPQPAISAPSAPLDPGADAAAAAALAPAVVVVCRRRRAAQPGGRQHRCDLARVARAAGASAVCRCPTARTCSIGRASRDPQGPRRGAGTGFVIDADGLILTNHHVVDGADRIMVRLTDGRNLHATRIGSDPDTDIALIKVESTRPLPFAPLGDSDSLRVGEWVVAIGNPLAYEHTVTVGVVSFIGRKLFDSSLDRYIQTDAAINFGNSGGPLINARGEVIGINAAISSRASNIGFAVPINQARAILPQLRDKGHVSRGLHRRIAARRRSGSAAIARPAQRSDGALVQDVTPGSPGARAGVRTYDLIVAVDGKAGQRQRPVDSDDRRAAAWHRRHAADPARQPSDQHRGEAGRAAAARPAARRQATRTRRRSRRASAARRSVSRCASSIAISPSGSSCPMGCRASSSRASSR